MKGLACQHQPGIKELANRKNLAEALFVVAFAK